MSWMKIQKSIYCKVNNFLIPILKKRRWKKINNHDFTIICNNCWGGYVYRHFGMPYLSPLIGLYLFAEDYIKLCKNLRLYFEKEITFISSNESKWNRQLKERGQTNVPIGKIDDIELIFLHYKDEKEAYEKWTRRIKRINYNNIIYKFSKMNECSTKELKEFDSLVVDKKICFVPYNEDECILSAIKYTTEIGDVVCDDTSEYSRYINLINLINAKKVNGNYME